MKCEICNAPYKYGDEFCGVCGARLGERKDAENKKEYTGPVIPPNPYTTPFGGIDENAEIEGVSAKEMAIFTGNKSYYFLPRFMLFGQGVRAIALNLFGFLFGAFYMLYRKMYVWGIVFLVITIALAVPGTIAAIANAENAYFEAGLLTSGSAIPKEMIIRLSELASIFDIIGLAVRIFIAFYVNKMYYIHVRDKILKLRRYGLEGTEYSELLSRSGGVSWKAILIALALFFAVYIIAGWSISGKVDIETILKANLV